MAAPSPSRPWAFPPNPVSLTIQYLINTVTKIESHVPTHSSEGRNTSSRQSRKLSFAATTKSIIARTEIDMGTALTTLTYLRNIEPRLRIAREGWAAKRILLGALIAANKYRYDDPLHIAYWTACTQQFNPRDVKPVKRELLVIVEYRLNTANRNL
ncbi:hypothetical protein EDB89DRAFT_1853403, partial [Lactarius sanguifluus]